MTALLLLLVGCNPHDGTLNGNYVVFMDAAASETITRLDTETKESIAERAGDLGLEPIDCRGLSADAGALEGSVACPETLTQWFTWLDSYGFYKKSGKLTAEGDGAPWRVEALMTSEGGLQLTSHLDVDGIGDLRFGWVIDPDFGPVICEDDDENGVSHVVEVDGDWVESWSAGSEGKVWHLTGGAYQINPTNTDDYWYFPREWGSGVSFGRFAQEAFTGQPISYTDPAGVPLYHPDYDSLSSGFGVDPWFPVGSTSYEEWRTEVDTTLNESTELADLGGVTDWEPLFLVEENTWRVSEAEVGDEDAGGMENWVGISTGWVRIDNPDAIKVDNETPVTGEFQVYLRAANAGSAIIVRSEFTLDHIRDDKWGYSPTLEEQKVEENNTPTCGEERLNFAEGEI